MRRLALIFAVGLAWGGLTAPVAAQTPDEVQAIIQQAAAEYGVSGDWLLSVARCESRLDPHAVGDYGASLGVLQLNRHGLLPLFFARGFSDPFNVAESAAFSAWAFSQGMARHWTCARSGR